MVAVVMLEGSTRKSSETSIADSQRPPRQLSEGVELKDFVEKDTQIDHLQKNHWLGVYQLFLGGWGERERISNPLLIVNYGPKQICAMVW